MVNLKDVSPLKTGKEGENYDQSIIVNRIACGDARD